jgi:hypothetical protein
MKQYNRWFSKVAIVAVVIGTALSCVTGVVLAADSCDCFCGNSKLGALKTGSYDSQSECARACSEASTTYVGCYTNESLYPENNNLCWTQDECESYPIKIATSDYTGEWSHQNPYCSKQEVTGSPMGYCYGPLIPVVLNVPILGVTEVGTIGDYVNLVYKYAIPAASLFAALMFTIAGFQYMTAGGDKGAVSKAKDRMVNTVLGIVLLLSVYAIAYLIDPRLTRFNELRPPLVKKAVLVNDLTTCEALFGYGFCIDGKCKEKGNAISGECGTKGKITDDSNVDLNIANAPEVGDDCTYSGCSDKSKSCLMKGDNSGGLCVSCNEISQLNRTLGVVPSKSTCSQIATRAQARDTNSKHIYACYYDDDFVSLNESGGVGADECVQLYTSGKEYIDCAAIQGEAKEEKDGCLAYEYVNADSYGWAWSGNFEELFGQGSADGIEDFKDTFADLCQRDVCSVADLGSTPQGFCSFEDTSSLEDVADFFSYGLFTLFDNYSCIGEESLNPPEEEFDPDMFSPSTF